MVPRRQQPGRAHASLCSIHAPLSVSFSSLLVSCLSLQAAVGPWRPSSGPQTQRIRTRLRPLVSNRSHLTHSNLSLSLNNPPPPPILSWFLALHLLFPQSLFLCRRVVHSHSVFIKLISAPLGYFFFSLRPRSLLAGRHTPNTWRSSYIYIYIYIYNIFQKQQQQHTHKKKIQLFILEPVSLLS